MNLPLTLDLIQSRKETRQQKTLVSKLIMEMERLKERFCHIVDCTNDEAKKLCPDRCEKGRMFYQHSIHKQYNLNKWRLMYKFINYNLISSRNCLKSVKSENKKRRSNLQLQKQPKLFCYK